MINTQLQTQNTSSEDWNSVENFLNSPKWSRLSTLCFLFFLLHPPHPDPAPTKKIKQTYTHTQEKPSTIILEWKSLHNHKSNEDFWDYFHNLLLPGFKCNKKLPVPWDSVPDRISCHNTVLWPIISHLINISKKIINSTQTTYV